MTMKIARACVSGALAALVLTASPQSARADWLRAESERFIVYSEGNERSLREYVQKLEMFDRVMLFQSGILSSTTPPRKLPIYLVSGRAGLTRVHPQSTRDTVGTYFPTEEDIFAVAIRNDDGMGMSGQDVLMHEYAHHFMLGNTPGAYPAWYVEGFAEYYMTADIKVSDNSVILGGYNQNRAYWIMSENWIPLDVLLRSRPDEVRNGSQRTTYYPIAWLLTHWFFSDTERRTQFQAYLADIAKGTDSVEAMERATGMSLEQLRAALRRYTRANLSRQRVAGRFPTPEITVTRLPRSANDLLLINQRLKIGVPQNDRAALGEEVARLAARHGDDPLALLAAGHAGMHFGNRPAGETALQRLLEIEPDNIEALQFLAQERLRQLREADSDAEQNALRREARDYIARAYAAAQNDYRTLMLMTELRQGQPNYPNDNDMLAMGLTLDRAPQLPAVRFNYAAALAEKNEIDEAIAVLRPLANNPHGGGASRYANRMIASLEAGGTLSGLAQDDDDEVEDVPSDPDAPET
ncbi:tetratricopeptide (TPR) repeat protein [Brevundimonas nasdae]|nr:hypothetical protein [Brevundimonas nasdae]MBK6025637.1 hypothetical protein [Brevundimonas nasdae]MDQ0452269.1 tetratricopeptide (TPR) repeat protein [Brevundimonas nasdae]